MGKVNAFQQMMKRDVEQITDVLQAGHNTESTIVLLAQVCVDNEVDMIALVGAVALIERLETEFAP